MCINKLEENRNGVMIQIFLVLSRHHQNEEVQENVIKGSEL